MSSINLTTDKEGRDNGAVENANKWAGQLVNIYGEGGWIMLAEAKHNASVSTQPYVSSGRSRFLIEAVPEMPGVVTFRVEGTDLYLTNIIYGDQHRQDVAGALASIPGILADNIGIMVDYAVGRPTNDSNFEGAGFSYSPVTTQRGPPNKLQMFHLESGRRNRNSLGVKSLFGTYWRSPCWDRIVSQSLGMLGDETFQFNVANPDDGGDVGVRADYFSDSEESGSDSDTS